MGAPAGTNGHRVLIALATTAVTAVVAAALTSVPNSASVAIASGDPCVNGVVPLNPYVVNCNLPARGDHIVGAAPDAGAIIACRHNLTCLSYYVNYPGALLVPGYRP